VRLFFPDKCVGLVESLREFYPDGLWQRCVVHFYREVKELAAMLEAIHAQEERPGAGRKAEQLADVAALVLSGIYETLYYYYAIPREHWGSLRMNNLLERLMREVRLRTRAGGHISRWQVRNARRGKTASRRQHQVGHAPPPGHEPPRGGERSGMNPRAKTFGSPSGEPSTTRLALCLNKCGKKSGHSP
jgi:hypothetical protein